MKDIHSQEQINEMRKRLYQRGAAVEKTVRHKLSDNPVEVSRDWSGVANSTTTNTDNTNDVRKSLKADLETAPTETSEPVQKKKRKYRSFILIGSLLIFVFGVGIASLYLYFGGNQISSDNIAIAINAPSSVGGGEVLPMQIAVSNNNSVPIEAATLILKYPIGTRSVGEIDRSLLEERILVEDVGPGEVKNIPVKVAIFGEENSERNIEAKLEYRVGNSNGVFYKEAAPLAFRISSAPLVLRIENLEKVASGQLVDITMTAVSNAPTPLKDILITASYPNGFTFENSSPNPFYGQNVWKIDEILPEEEMVIELSGVVGGLTEETFRINFEAGPQDSNNQNQISAALTDAKADFIIERPFIDVAININGDSDRKAILSEGEDTTVSLDIKNTLDETVYDMAVEVISSGNALTDESIVTSSGFFDSNTGTVRWEVSNNESFDKILPGDVRSFDFKIAQGPTKSASSFDLIVNVYARRVGESSALETLIGNVTAEAKYSSKVYVNNQAGKNTADYVDRGPIPPVVGEESTYTLTVVAEAGANDMVNSIVETSLPLYVDWLDIYDAEGEVTYNSVSKKLRWSVGNIDAGDRKDLTMQVSILPSTSQLEEAPVLLNRQQIRANDRFTGELLQNIAAPVTTELSTEFGFARENGLVTQ